MDQLQANILVRKDLLVIPLETRSLALLATSAKLELLHLDLLSRSTKEKCVFLENTVHLDLTLPLCASRDSSALNIKL
jgi:hypothetical protein